MAESEVTMDLTTTPEAPAVVPVIALPAPAPDPVTMFNSMTPETMAMFMKMAQSKVESSPSCVGTSNDNKRSSTTQDKPTKQAKEPKGVMTVEGLIEAIDQILTSKMADYSWQGFIVTGNSGFDKLTKKCPYIITPYFDPAKKGKYPTASNKSSDIYKKRATNWSMTNTDKDQHLGSKKSTKTLEGVKWMQGLVNKRDKPFDLMISLHLACEDSVQCPKHAHYHIICGKKSGEDGLNRSAGYRKAIPSETQFTKKCYHIPTKSVATCIAYNLTGNDRKYLGTNGKHLLKAAKLVKDWVKDNKEVHIELPEEMLHGDDSDSDGSSSGLDSDASGSASGSSSECDSVSNECHKKVKEHRETEYDRKKMFAQEKRMNKAETLWEELFVMCIFSQQIYEDCKLQLMRKHKDLYCKIKTMTGSKAYEQEFWMDFGKFMFEKTAMECIDQYYVNHESDFITITREDRLSSSKMMHVIVNWFKHRLDIFGAMFGAAEVLLEYIPKTKIVLFHGRPNLGKTICISAPLQTLIHPHVHAVTYSNTFQGPEIAMGNPRHCILDDADKLFAIIDEGQLEFTKKLGAGEKLTVSAKYINSHTKRVPGGIIMTSNVGDFTCFNIVDMTGQTEALNARIRSKVHLIDPFPYIGNKCDHYIWTHFWLFLMKFVYHTYSNYTTDEAESWEAKSSCGFVHNGDSESLLNKFIAYYEEQYVTIMDKYVTQSHNSSSKQD